MNRFFVDKPLSAAVHITGADAHHIISVLRLSAGDLIVLTGCCQQTGLYTIKSVAARNVEAELSELIREQQETPISVVLAQGLIKSDKMDYVVQKAVELGVRKIVPLAVKNCVVKYAEHKQKNRVERWQRIANEAAKQCRRSLLPAVAPVYTLPELLQGISAGTKIIMLYEGKALQGLKAVLQDCGEITDLLLIVGPEGGFCQTEVELCLEYKSSIATLGPRILRTETAALAAVSAVMYEFGCLGGG